MYVRSKVNACWWFITWINSQKAAWVPNTCATRPQYLHVSALRLHAHATQRSIHASSIIVDVYSHAFHAGRCLKEAGGKGFQLVAHQLTVKI